MVKSRVEHMHARDGHAFTGYLAIPESGSGPGMVVAQEIFGVTDYIKDVCARLSELGYVALAPDLYSRIDGESLIDERTENALPRAFGAMQKLDFPQAAGDAADALGHLRDLAEVPDGRAGIIGFCLGGGMAYFVAADSDPDVAVCYYGSAIPGNLDKASEVQCPVLFEFGDADEYITAEQRAAVEAGVRGTAPHRVPSASRAESRLRQSQRRDVPPPRSCRCRVERDDRIPGTRVSGIGGQNLSAPRSRALRAAPARR